MSRQVFVIGNSSSPTSDSKFLVTPPGHTMVTGKLFRIHNDGPSEIRLQDSENVDPPVQPGQTIYLETKSLHITVANTGPSDYATGWIELTG